MAARTKTIQIAPIKTARATVTIEGISPLIMHAWDQKVATQLRDARTGEAEAAGRQQREHRKPDEEFEAARYRLSDGSDGVRVASIKNALLYVADYKRLGISKTDVRKAFFIEPDDLLQQLVRILSPTPPKMREDMVRLPTGAPDFRWRPEYWPWEIALRFEYDSTVISSETILNLLQRAGYSSGLGDWRPSAEKSGDFGRFRVKLD